MHISFYAIDTAGDEWPLRGYHVKQRPNLRKEAKGVLAELHAREAKYPDSLVPATAAVRVELSKDRALVAAETACV